jgi:hypothetical protein
MAEEKEYYALTKKTFDFLAPFYDLIVQSQDIANCFESSSYFGGVPGHREQCEAFLW